MGQDGQKLLIKKKHIEMLKDDDVNYAWHDLLVSGVIEYIDTMEEETTMIATSPELMNPAEDGSYYCQSSKRQLGYNSGTWGWEYSSRILSMESVMDTGITSCIEKDGCYIHS